jgi:putative ABC transport system permease protein
MILILVGVSHGIGSAVIALAGIFGFLIDFLFTYMSVLARTHEIGILKALGASSGYILGILLREAVFLAVAGTIAGIAATYCAHAVINSFAPTMTIRVVKVWWLWVALLSIAGSLVGSLLSGLRAARTDAIKVLDYD